jgi:hypothetical protein
VDIDKLDALRAYAFQYATGMLWMLAFLVLFAGPPDYVAFFARLNTKLIPETLVTILAVGLGIIVPYAIATALWPLSFQLHELFLRVDRAFRVKVLHRASRKHELRDGARQKLGRLGIPQAQDDELLVFIHGTNPRLAAILELERHEAWFHATSILPTALLVGACAYKINWGILSGVTLGLLAVVVGVMHAEKEMVVWLDRVDAAVLLAADGESQSATKK